MQIKTCTFLQSLFLWHRFQRNKSGIRDKNKSDCIKANVIIWFIDVLFYAHIFVILNKTQVVF